MWISVSWLKITCYEILPNSIRRLYVTYWWKIDWFVWVEDFVETFWKQSIDLLHLNYPCQRNVCWTKKIVLNWKKGNFMGYRHPTSVPCLLSTFSQERDVRYVLWIKSPDWKEFFWFEISRPFSLLDRESAALGEVASGHSIKAYIEHIQFPHSWKLFK